MFKAVTHTTPTDSVTVDLQDVQDELIVAHTQTLTLATEIDLAQRISRVISRPDCDAPTILALCNEDGGLTDLLGRSATEALATESGEKVSNELDDRVASAVGNEGDAGRDTSTRKTFIRWVSALSALCLVLISGYFLMRKFAKKGSMGESAPIPHPPVPAPPKPAATPAAPAVTEVHALSADTMRELDKELTEYNLIVGRALIAAKSMTEDVRKAGARKGARSGTADNHLPAIEAMTADAREKLAQVRALAAKTEALPSTVVESEAYTNELNHHRTFVEESTRRLKPSIIKLVKLTREACGSVGMHYLKSPAVTALLSRQTDLVKFADETKHEL